MSKSVDADQVRPAIVSGGAGGIGSAIAERLAESGYRVIVADANAEAASVVACGLPNAQSLGHRGFGGDLTDADVNRELVHLAAADGDIRVVVNAVGISPKADGAKRPFYDIDDDEWDRVMAVNVRAPFLLIREAYSRMSHDGSASIVNLLSITAKLGTGGAADAPFGPHLPSSAVYGASKGALQTLTASLSRELAPFRIRVNGVAPGFVATPMMSSVPSESAEALAAQVPLGRFATPGEIADAVEFLVGERAAYITGTSLDVNGGWLTC